MDYVIDKAQLLADIKKEVSHEAVRKFSDEGASLYDAIYPTSRDEETLIDIINDTLTTLCVQLRFARPLKTVDRISFNLPDFSMEMADEAISALSRYIVLESCREWFSRVDTDLAKQYSSKRDSAYSNIVNILYSRTKPIRR